MSSIIVKDTIEVALKDTPLGKDEQDSPQAEAEEPRGEPEKPKAKPESPQAQPGPSQEGEQEGAVGGAAALPPESGPKPTAKARIPRKRPTSLHVIPYYLNSAQRPRVRFVVSMPRLDEQSIMVYKVVMTSVDAEEPGKVDPNPVIFERRYTDFHGLYQNINIHGHIHHLKDFVFPDKYVVFSTRRRVLEARTTAFNNMLALIANCHVILYTPYFQHFCGYREINKAMDMMNAQRYDEALPYLDKSYRLRNKLQALDNIRIVKALNEMVAVQATNHNYEKAYSYALVALEGFEYHQGVPVADKIKVPFLLLAIDIGKRVKRDTGVFEDVLSDLREDGVNVDRSTPLLEIVRGDFWFRNTFTWD